MSESIFRQYPEERKLLSEVLEVNENILPVNGHFHTPYSFSAFSEIIQVFEMAEEEGVKVLGINDFYTTDGYVEFNRQAKKFNIFPLFNIEFMALQKDLQAEGVRVNDPNNPGRTYFSGKGLKYPVEMNAEMLERLLSVQDESNRQTAEMIGKLNDWLKELGEDISFSFETMRAKYAKNLLRERHIAKALREAIADKYTSEEQQKAVWQKIFSGKEPKSAMDDFAGLENEIRGNLLKSGGKAFVPEDDKAFLSLEQVIDLIIHAGGIPCYPVLLDNPKGEFTDFEGDYEKLYQSLVTKNVYSLELIPGRNKPEILEQFVNFFNDKGFVITFGTEHNTPKLDPITILGGDGKELSPAMKKIGYEGACVVAAHQYLVASDKEGFLDATGSAKLTERDEFIALGHAVISHFVK
ncbi:PHP domain-containing protein [uncultured Sunxiuqinia sp.]|uniref:PHP domain-containing protein n=1 Tax=uncultured Sunxiuqinia sp. TaxID=1573825 RepID=UPI002AA618FC|nr:PHP domain-containing protein [uncultured Sunxiuqinia sp.]